MSKHWYCVRPTGRMRVRDAAPRLGAFIALSWLGGCLDSVTPPVTVETGGIQPSWSPDGTRIAFSLYGGSLAVSVMNADGSGFARLMTGANPPWKR